MRSTRAPSGHIELDWAVAAIHVGRRHRHDLGDLGELIDSIRQLGLLQPITISPDGTLICGARRLAAVKHLGVRQINVWVRGGVSNPLHQLLAEQHENTLRKPYSPREAAALYRELKDLIAEDNARRQEATRFGSDTGPPCGAADSAAPSDRTSRAQAARMVTGRRSYTMLDHVGELETLAADPNTPSNLRDLATAELAAAEKEGKVEGHYRRVKAAQATAGTDPTAHSPSHPPSAGNTTGTPSRRRPAPTSDSAKPRKRGVRSFLLTWQALAGWTDRYDPAQIGPALTEQQWNDFTSTLTATIAFADAARAARDT
jgi:ParB family chromosome partitioning protein